jgi:hypothetical protein
MNLEGLIERHNGEPWDWGALVSNPNIPPVIDDIARVPPSNDENIKKYYDSINSYTWDKSMSFDILLGLHDSDKITLDWNFISIFIDISIVNRYPELPWSYHRLSINESLTLDYVKANLNKDWNWDVIRTTFNIKEVSDLLWKQCKHPESHVYQNLEINTSTFITNLINTQIVSGNITIKNLYHNNGKLPLYKCVPGRLPRFILFKYKDTSIHIDVDIYLKQYVLVAIIHENKISINDYDLICSFTASTYINPTKSKALADITKQITEKEFWDNLSSNPTLDLNFVDENPDLPWNWGLISKNYFKYDPILNNYYRARIKRKRTALKKQLPHFHKLTKHIKQQPFIIWYCKFIGSKIDKTRISNLFK